MSGSYLFLKWYKKLDIPEKYKFFCVLECHFDTAKMNFTTVSKCSGAVWVCGIEPLAQVISVPQAYQFLARLIKEYSLTRGEVTSPAQEPTKACSCAFYSLVIVIAWIQLKHGVNALATIEGVNLLCVLSNTSQNRVSDFAFLVT